MTSFKFIHAADVHLDSPLLGLSRYEGIPHDEIRGATRGAFDNLVRYAIEQAVDFVVISGDLFDGDWKDMSTGLYFARAVGLLDQAAIPSVSGSEGGPTRFRSGAAFRGVGRSSPRAPARPETVKPTAGGSKARAPRDRCSTIGSPKR